MLGHVDLDVGVSGLQFPRYVLDHKYVPLGRLGMLSRTRGMLCDIVGSQSPGGGGLLFRRVGLENINGHEHSRLEGGAEEIQIQQDVVPGERLVDSDGALPAHATVMFISSFGAQSGVAGDGVGRPRGLKGQLVEAGPAQLA